MEAERSSGLLSASWGPRKSRGVIQFESGGLRIGGFWVEADGVFHHLSPKAGEQGVSEGRRGGRRRSNREMEFALCLVYVLLRPHQVKGAPALAKLGSSVSP